MRFYSWKTAPFELPALTSARVCPLKHYMRTEHVATGKVQEFDAGGRELEQLAGVTEFPDPLEEEKPLHDNLNVPLRKPPASAKPAAPAVAPAPAAAAAAAAPAGPAAPATEPA
jgi:hypothetical protein